MESSNQALEAARQACPRLRFVSDAQCTENYLGDKLAYVCENSGEVFQYKRIDTLHDEKAISLKTKDSSLPIQNCPLEGTTVEFLNRVEEAEIAAIKQQQQLAMGIGLADSSCHDVQLTVLDRNTTRDIERAITEGTLTQELESLECQCRLASQNAGTVQGWGKKDFLNARLVKLFHWRNVVRSLLSDKPADSLEDPRWKNQLRTYYENKVVLRVGDLSIDHGCRLQRDCTRLVYTPLTDQAYQFLCETLQANKTCQIMGPAGTGKAETIQNLCKDLGLELIRIECSDQIFANHMVEIHKGWAATGCMIVFEEYNRILLEVMEESIKMTHELLGAMKDKKTEVTIGQHTFNIKEGCGWFATMNPGYAGRTPIPEVQKQEGRSMNFTVPDFADITSVSLASNGIVDAEKIGPMIVNLSQDGRDHLSKQCHYDFGMRWIKAITEHVGEWRRAYLPDADEVPIAAQVIRVYNSRLTSEDLVKWEELMAKHGFPKASGDDKIPNSLEPYIKCANGDASDSKWQAFAKRCSDLMEIQKRRNGSMVLGSDMAANATLVNTTAKVHGIDVVRINVDKFTCDTLYGYYDENKKWVVGEFSEIFKKFDEKPRWIVLEGEVTSMWVESMNRILDGHSELALANGEVYPLGDYTKLVFESPSAKQASPAFVSRVGVVLVEE